MEGWDGGGQGQQVGDEGLTLVDDANWYSGKRASCLRCSKKYGGVSWLGGRIGK